MHLDVSNLLIISAVVRNKAIRLARVLRKRYYDARLYKIYDGVIVVIGGIK